MSDSVTQASNVLLASSSPYRRELLQRLGLDFDWAAPEIDETALPGEAPEALVQRLAAEKARALQADFPDRLIIGSDQVATLDESILTKPLTRERAIAQLTTCSGRRVRFFTGLALLDAASNHLSIHLEPFDVVFRSLSSEDVTNYVDRETPFDCAGSFRVEGPGIALFQALEGRDPNALIGLPLIALCDLLRERGINPLQARPLTPGRI